MHVDLLVASRCRPTSNPLPEGIHKVSNSNLSAAVSGYVSLNSVKVILKGPGASGNLMIAWRPIYECDLILLPA